MKGRLCVVLHDVAPSTWPDCIRILAMLDELRATPLTLLIVPQFHQGCRIDDDADFVAAIRQRVVRGDEIALHGYFHRDTAAKPTTLSQWFRRRVMTAGEGEFAGMDRSEANARIVRGLKLFQRLGWHAQGFVAPAWLASDGTLAALSTTGLRYTSSHTTIIDLENGTRIDAPCITVSARSAWRRAASRLWMNIAYALTRRKATVRVGLHPIDARHPAIMAAWHVLLARLLTEREAITKTDVITRSSTADARTSRFDVPGESP